MSTCWWCHWGWPKQISDIYKKALSQLTNDSSLNYGPAHVVWADENWDCVQWCLDNFDSWKSECNKGQFSDFDLEIVRQSLIELMAVPDEFKIEPIGYDDSDSDESGNPENFPPPLHWIMIRQY